MSMVAALALLIVGPASLHSTLPDDPGIVLLIFLLLGLSLVVWQIALSGGRFMQRQIIPVLATSLAPLQPKQSEIQSVADELKQLRHKIGSKTNVETLMEAVSAARGHR